MKRDSINIRASSVAFKFFVSLFPTLLVFFTVIPFIPIPTFQNTVMSTIHEVLPENVYSLLNSTIEDIVLRHRAELLSISLFLALYFSSRGVIGLMNSFDKALPTFRKRTFWQKQIVAFKINSLLFLLLLFSVGLVIGGEFVVRSLMKVVNADSNTIYLWFTIVRWISILFIFYISISLIYFYGPATHKRWKFFSAGSSLATFLAVIISLIFSWAINEFGQYNKLYGSIGTFLVLQLWIYYNSLSLLIGFELNASIDMNENKIITRQAEELD